MATSFDEQALLPIDYSAHAEGGPEFATAVIRSGEGGSIAHRAETREDFISKYDILYGELENERRRALRDFGILRRGMSRGFRFLAPDDSTFIYDQMAIDSSGTLVLAASSGSTVDFYVVRGSADVSTSYLKRITKISPYVALIIQVFHTSDLVNPAASLTFTAQNEGSTIPNTRGQTNSGVPGGTRTYTMNLWTGVLNISAALPSSYIVKIASGQYHVPVAFTEDWHKFRVDTAAISEVRIGVEEILPVEIGITL